MTSLGAILVISGPSGSGKSSLFNIIKERIPNLHFSLSTTTREKRGYETEGVHYHFVSKEEFLRGIDEDEFLEWAEVHGNFYGTSKKAVNNALKEGKLVVFDIDVQGHHSIKAEFENITTSVFINTVTRAQLIERLRGRGSESEESINTRVAHAMYELKNIDEYDFIILNDDLESSAKKLESIANAALCKRGKYDTKHLISEWSKH